MWHTVHWAVVMCMACYKRWWLVFVVCVLTLLELDHKMPSQRVLLSSFGNLLSLACFLYIHFAVCLCIGALLFFEGDVVSPSL